MATKTSRSHKSIKHDIIDKDNTRIVLAVGIAVFLTVFCGFAIKTLFSQSLYHNRVIGEKKDTLEILRDNEKALDTLADSYTAFVAEPENILGGNPAGDGPLDGDNATIVLDALPGVYDYPALASSFEKILIEGGYDTETIGGTENRGADNTATSDVKPIKIPYSFSFASSLDDTQKLLTTLESSIRPMNVDQLAITVGTDGRLSTQVSLHTFYTQQKAFELGSKEVK